jgi:hypothetical protein
VSPVKYELGFYIPEDDILHSPRHENLKSYIALTGWTVQRRRNVSPVRYELGFYIPGDDILHLESTLPKSLPHGSIHSNTTDDVFVSGCTKGRLNSATDLEHSATLTQ